MSGTLVPKTETASASQERFFVWWNCPIQKSNSVENAKKMYKLCETFRYCTNHVRFIFTRCHEMEVISALLTLCGESIQRASVLTQRPVTWSYQLLNKYSSCWWFETHYAASLWSKFCKLHGRRFEARALYISVHVRSALNVTICPRPWRQCSEHQAATLQPQDDQSVDFSLSSWSQCVPENDILRLIVLKQNWYHNDSN